MWCKFFMIIHEFYWPDHEAWYCVSIHFLGVETDKLKEIIKEKKGHFSEYDQDFIHKNVKDLQKKQKGLLSEFFSLNY